MKYCIKCGTELADDVKFCPACGQPSEVKTVNADQSDKKAEYQKKIEDAVVGFVNTNDVTDEFDSADISNNKALSILSYINILFIIPLIAAPQSKFAKFHANQGLILFLFEVVISCVGGIVSSIAFMVWEFLGTLVAGVLSIVGIVTFIFMIIGIINAAQGKAKELPIIGGFRFIK